MKIGTKIRAALLAAILFAPGCGSDDESLPGPQGMRFSRTRYELLPGKTIRPQLLIRIGGIESDYDPVRNLYKIGWTTENPEVAQVAADGTVTALGYGMTQLVANSTYLHSPVTAEIAVVPAGLRLDAARYAFSPGKSVRPRLLLTEEGKEMDSDNRFGIVWSTADERIAAVAQDGTVTGVGYGTTTLTGSSPLLDKELTAEIAVEVEGLRFAEEQYVLDIGGTVRPRLLMTAGDEEREADADIPTTWRIADDPIASLAEDHTVTGLQSGTTTLTVRSPYYPQEVTARIVVRGPWSGEWMLAQWDGSDRLAGHVYMRLNDDGTFVLYQNIDVSGFAVFRGDYFIRPDAGKSVLSGVYDDGVPWRTSYYLSRSGDNLLLTDLVDGIVSEYVRTPIPDFVKDGIAAKASGRALRTGSGRFL